MHVSALAGLCTLACLAFEKNIQRAGAVLFVFVYGLVMEWLQNFSLDRHGTMEDVAANAMGCLAGVLLYFTIRGLHGLKRRCAIKQPKETKE
ncbi:MAG: VanZ family protein [Victivallaceae bacterium]